MTNFEEMWFQSMCDAFNEIEMEAMDQEAYLELERQLEITKKQILLLVQGQDKELAQLLINRMEEHYVQMYNLVMKDLVTAVKFRHFSK